MSVRAAVGPPRALCEGCCVHRRDAGRQGTAALPPQRRPSRTVFICSYLQQTWVAVCLEFGTQERLITFLES